MNRNNIYTVNPLYNGSTTQTTEDGSVQSGGTTIIYQQGGGTGLTDAQKQKLDGIQEGAEVNQNAYSKVRLNGSDALIIEAKNKTDILNMSGVYPIAIAINGNGGLDFTVSSDQTNTNAVVTQSQLQAAIEKLQEDKYWKVDEDGKLYTELDVYSHKEISAYGAGTGGGSTGGAGALYECADVLRDGDKVQGAAVGSILSYNGSHWYAIPQSAITPDLTNYATKSYVTQQINDLIGGAPGTLDTLKEIAEALGNNPNFATTVTEMINNIGLRVDQVEDRVVSLEDMFEWDKSASASDPSLWRIKAKKDLYGVGEISAYGLGETQPSVTTLAGLDDVTITSPANGQTLIYDSATSQWKNGTIIGGGNISLNGTVYKPVNGTITLPNLATPGDITTALNGYATQAWVTDKNYATQSWVNGKGYVTATVLATMGFATQAWVNSQGFLKSNSLDNYVTLNTIQNITAAKTFQGGIVSTTFRKSDGTASQFLKADGSVDSNVYLTQSSTDTRYVLKTGDTMGGALIIDVSNIPASPSISSPAKIGFKENHTQEVAFAYTDYDSHRAPAGIKLVSTENEPWFEAPWILGRKLNMSRVATEYSAGTGAVINYFGTDTIMDNRSGSVIGTMKIRLPVNWTNTMGVYKIMLYEYNGRGSSEITVSFYNYSSSQSYHNYSYQLNGAFEGAVRIAHDGSGCCILLGDTSYNWNYIKVYVYQVFNGQSVPSNYVDQPYNISIITSEAGLSKVTSIPKTSINRHDDNYIRAINKNGYYGMGKVGNIDTDWIRTAKPGLIPFEPGSSPGNSFLGTETWQFGKIFGAIIYGQRVCSLNHNLYLGSSGNSGWVYCQDLCSANGAAEAYWSIRTNGAAVFTNLTSNKLNVSGDIRASSWIRTDGATGWYSQSYGGGIHMTDSTWVRVYNGKQFYVSSTSSDAIHTAGGINASGRIYAGGHLSTNGGLAVSGICGGSGASGFNVYARFYGNGQHGGIEIGASDNVFGIGVHSNDHIYWWWTNSGSVGSSSNKSYIMDYGGGSWNFTGSIVASGEVTAYSDARLKSNIHTLDYRGRLIPRHYVKDGKQSIGFIAQEVQTLYPELVLGYDKSRPYLSLNYNGCTAVLSAQLNYVEDEVTMLKNKVRELEIKVSVLTEQLHSQAI